MLDAAARETGLSGQKARDLLGGFLFSGADVDKPLRDISGGEQRRLSLAILVASGANVLILDEPTNHLDIESREALEDALLAFEGAVILVSHDRALLEAVGSRTLVCEGGRLNSHLSGWAEYQRERDEKAESGSKTRAAAKTRQPQQQRRPRRLHPARKRPRPSARSPGWRRRSSGPRRRWRSSRTSSPTRASGRPRKRAKGDPSPRPGQQKVAELYEQWEQAAETVAPGA